MLRHMGSCLNDGGRLLIIAAARRTRPVRRALRSVGFGTVETFAIVPSLAPMKHLVSTHPLAMRTFMLRAHGLPLARPRHLLQVPRWLAVYLGADRIGIRWYLFDAQL